MALFYDIPVGSGSHAHKLFEDAVVIAGVIKAYGVRKALHGVGGRVAALHALCRFKDAVREKIVKGRTAGAAFKTAAAFTPADMYAVCDVIQSDGFGKMRMDVIHGVLYALFVGQRMVVFFYLITGVFQKFEP